MSGAGGAKERFTAGGRRKLVLAVGVAALLSAGASAAVGAVAHYGQLVAAFRTANAPILPACLAGEAAAYAGYLVSYRDVAAAVGGLVLRYRDVARVVVFGFGGAVLGAAAGSLGVDFAALRAAGAGTHEAVRRTLALNTLHAAALMTFATIAGVVVLARGAGGALLVMAAVWTAAVPLAAAAAAVVTSRRVAQRLVHAEPGPPRPRGLRPSAWLRWLAAGARRGFADTIGGVLLVRLVLVSPRRYLGGILGYPLFWLGDFFVLWTALLAFGVRLDPPTLVVAEATAWLLVLLPLPVGGSGAAEAAMAYSLHAVGVPLAEALPAALVYRAISFWLPLIPALLLLPQMAPLRHDLEQAERAEPDPDPEAELLSAVQPPADGR
jgi:uncharacterized membrane protein YbhN (UPF0104 family)